MAPENTTPREIDCQFCEGTGKTVFCPQCNGAGQVALAEDEEESRCPNCQGLGTVAPPPASGEGKEGAGSDLAAKLAPYASHVQAPGPMCERAKHSDYPCTCGLDALLAQVAAAPRPSSSQPQAPELEEALTALSFLRKAIDFTEGRKGICIYVPQAKQKADEVLAKYEDIPDLLPASPSPESLGGARRLVVESPDKEGA